MITTTVPGARFQSRNAYMLSSSAFLPWVSPCCLLSKIVLSLPALGLSLLSAVKDTKWTQNHKDAKWTQNARVNGSIISFHIVLWRYHMLSFRINIQPAQPSAVVKATHTQENACVWSLYCTEAASHSIVFLALTSAPIAATCLRGDVHIYKHN
jgi:hypothetical protein